MKEFMYNSQKSKSDLPNSIPIQRIKELDEALVNCVIEDARPFGDFSKPGMVNFLKIALPGYTPPERHTVTIRLAKKYKKYRSQLTEYLKLINHLALTTDLYKNKHLVYFLGLTLHFFDDDFNFISLIIGFRKFCGRHQSVRIKNFIRIELNKIEISKKIIATTADNAADIVKALKGDVFGVRFSSFCHNLNLSLKDVVKQTKPIQPNGDDLQSTQSESESQSDNVSGIDKHYESNKLAYDSEASEESNDEESSKDSPPSEQIMKRIQNLIARIRILVKMVRKCGNICSYAKK